MTRTRTTLSLFVLPRRKSLHFQPSTPALHLQQQAVRRRTWHEIETERRRREQEIATPVRLSLLVRVVRLWA